MTLPQHTNWIRGMTFLVSAGRLRVLGLSLWPVAMEASIGENCYCLSCGGCWPVVFSWSIAVLSFMRPPSNVMAYHSQVGFLFFLTPITVKAPMTSIYKRCSFCGRDNEPGKPRVGPGSFGVKFRVARKALRLKQPLTKGIQCASASSASDSNYSSPTLIKT